MCADLWRHQVTSQVTGADWLPATGPGRARVAPLTNTPVGNGPACEAEQRLQHRCPVSVGTQVSVGCRDTSVR